MNGLESSVSYYHALLFLQKITGGNINSAGIQKRHFNINIEGTERGLSCLLDNISQDEDGFHQRWLAIFRDPQLANYGSGV
ncbi:MAG: hypothetical protein Q3M24_19315 [Candidatus Electrothrix aestuarii]|uniref:Uncharacterized protein n=1 Tax=Candidatus Electrothrix aestuarii TaxID=3062594 RepID=A0AAU8LU66_9BACT|nr:hypothetical protein [Candidatus Electrothrix aestuarii]